MRQFIRNLSLKWKIQLIVWVSVVFIALGSLAGIYLTASTYNRTVYQTTASALAVSSEQIGTYAENLNVMADAFLADNSIQRNLSVMKDSSDVQDIGIAYQNLYSSLTDYYFTYRRNNIRYLNLYLDNTTIRSHFVSASSLPDEVRDILIEKAKEADGSTVWVTDYCEDYGLFLVKMIKRTEYLKLDDLGVLVVNVDLNEIVEQASNLDFVEGNAVYAIYENDSLIYTSPLLGDFFENDLDLKDYGSIRYDHENFFYVKSSVPQINWIYCCLIPFNSISSSFIRSIIIYVVILIAAIAIASVLSSSMIKSLTRHFDNLLIKMRAFGNKMEDMPVIDYDYSTREDELGQIHRQFDQMVDEVNELIRTNYLDEILIKEAQYKALENQINPHFLYNTLESINWRARMIGADDISSMAQALGTMLRITLDTTTKEVPLEKELELIQCYMTIQKYRYEERLDFMSQIPEELMRYKVLKMTLQPLVENSVRYGLEENTECCHITISASADHERGKLSVYVKNNGSYFEDDLLERLKSGEAEPSGFGIGLINIEERMNLTYGDDYGLELYNEEDTAVACISYPLNIYEEGNI